MFIIPNEITPRKNFCPLPFNHTAIEANGDIKGCCLTPEFKREDGTSFNLNRDKLADVLESKDYRDFVDSFRRDERHPYCHECWAFDDQKSISNRHSYNDFTKQHMRVHPLENLQRDLKFLEIKVGNNCNLKCRICGPHNSSKSATEMAEITGSDKPLRFTEDSGWVNKEEIWQQFGNMDLEALHIMGGEPLIDKTHFPMLEALVASGRASHIGLWYNTNGTVFPEKHLELFSHFKWVKFSLSIDDIGERFEYQRFPAKWPLVAKNLERFLALDPQKFIVFVDICWSLMNIYYFDEIMSFYHDTYTRHGLRDGSPTASRHFYSGQDWIFCSKTIREDQKNKYLQRLENSSFWASPSHAALLKDLMQHIRYGDFNPATENLRVQQINRLDNYRQQSFAKTHPELKELLIST